MEKIYVIIASNNEKSPEDYYETSLGFAETEQEAERVIDVLKRTQIEDCDTIFELKSNCPCGDTVTNKCKDCEILNKISRIERKDIYGSCYARVEKVTWSYKELKKMF